ncbi:hypothetical protein Poly24_06620 [Rosistilla carotiformis]|uniref:Uncharacterized protein n=1 Tax=Rosistilla carotiformis TaxID=2528017 RepID=A0A518JN68_9BACT|nr:hypothetical protein [Rosistilla carotiformis]QDV66972.1 hypothetical protein Poly24_06620 [Rosistilla carotiformis]
MSDTEQQFDEVDDIDGPYCEGCGDSTGDVESLGDSWYCDSCLSAALPDWKTEAREFALQQCKITTAIPEFDSLDQHRCTPDDYAMGYRESNTPNAYACRCRHEYTNYDALVAGFPQHGDGRDRIFYLAIRRRIEELLEEHPDFDSAGVVWDHMPE